MQQRQHGGGLNSPTHHNNSPVGGVALAVKGHQIIPRQRANRLWIARRGPPVGVIAVEPLAKAEIGPAARILLTLLQAHQPLGAHPFDLLWRKERMAQHIGQQPHHIGKIFREALRAKAGDMGAAAHSDTGPHRFHGLVERVEIIALAAAG